MSMREMIRNHLAASGADGLVNDRDGCWCELTDLMPCENNIGQFGSCEPALAQTCPVCGERFFTACDRRPK